MKFIKPEELRKELDSGNNNTSILDIRSPQEYAQGHIDNAVNLFFYSPKYKSMLEELDKDAKYLIYCGTDCKSTEVANEMKRLGIRKITVLSGGYAAWIGEKVGYSACSS